MTRLTSLAALVFITVVACGTAARQGEMSVPPQRHMTFAAGEQLEAAQYPTLHQALEALRPTMLRVRGGSQPLVVVVDGAVAGGVEVLRTIRTADVLSVERTSGLRERGGQSTLVVRLR